MPGFSPRYDGDTDRAEQQHEVEALEQLGRGHQPLLHILRRSISCSLPNATIEPQNDTEPMIAANSDADDDAHSRRLVGLERRKAVGSMNSDHAMSATVPPPTPLNSATSCGMAVILVFWAGGTPSTTPTTRPAMIRTS